ncbi:acyl-CoA dehydrogenase family protein [Massilia pseudoviolaceinigra]|uniref:acyl-CoA dehydrogenase family protein n=1 Tax=Massilia pseudoviolaceinigra TaxID=3057165 RepID=UPI0027964FF6|nr:acyl-CoA dehydrogenase family protein [Massilia sp. CCM 9206]MDQ1920915.1 acyl-CoA dehydrogenase family protein [Massilia sp. CCM 9206]
MTDEQKECRDRARRFAAAHILPLAQHIDRDKVLPQALIEALCAEGWLGAALPTQWGGGGMDPVAYGLATEEIGKACSSVRSLLTSHNMATQAILRHGNAGQKERYLPELCAGRKIISFALTEENAGSAARSIATDAVENGPTYRVNGTKLWITCGLIAHVYLVFVRSDDKHLALVIERERPGVAVEPMPEVLGTRGSMLARLQLSDVDVPVSQRIGAVGAGISFVANTALDHGRFSVAWGAAGIIQACLDATHSYVKQRQQDGHSLAEHQLVRRQLTDMLLAYTSVRALCFRSACLRNTGDQRAAMETMLAKYHGASSAVETTTNALRMHGANGYSLDYPVERYLRDAMALEIIEGTREMNQVGLASYALQWPHINE